MLHFLCIRIYSACADSSNEERRKEAFEERERLKLELESIRTTTDTVEHELVHLEERMSALGEWEALQEDVVGVCWFARSHLDKQGKVCHCAQPLPLPVDLVLGCRPIWVSGCMSVCGSIRLSVWLLLGQSVRLCLCVNLSDCVDLFE